MGRVILANAFSLNMLQLSLYDTALVKVRRIDAEEFIRLTEMADDCAIGHESTVKLVELITGKKTKVPCSRKQIKLNTGDYLIVIMLSFRPEEGKVYTIDELNELYETGRISFYIVTLTDKIEYPIVVSEKLNAVVVH